MQHATYISVPFELTYTATVLYDLAFDTTTEVIAVELLSNKSNFVVVTAVLVWTTAIYDWFSLASNRVILPPVVVRV